MNKEKRSSKGLITGILIGGAAGSIIALLFAPQSGRELRRDIRKRKDLLINDAERFIDDKKLKAGRLIEESKRKAGQLISDAKEKAASLTNGAEKLYSQGKDLIGDEASKLKDAVKAGIDTYSEERKKGTITG